MVTATKNFLRTLRASEGPDLYQSLASQHSFGSFLFLDQLWDNLFVESAVSLVLVLGQAQRWLGSVRMYFCQRFCSM